MFTLVSAFGTPALQLPGLNQPLEVAPVQLVTWACVETVHAMKNATAASNLKETNLQPAPVPDVEPQCGPVDDNRRGSHPNISPQPIGHADK